MKPTRAGDTPGYAYSARPTRNPFVYMRAVWRLIRNDPTETTPEAAIVEIGFARSRWGRRFARWEQTVAVLAGDPRTAPALERRLRFGPIVLSQLDSLPEGTLGRTFADHCRAAGIDPNLVQVPPDGDVGWLLNHLYQTHDIWHVVTGWGNDLAGEVGLGGFYAAQLRSPAFFGVMLALVVLNVIWRRADLDEVLSALSAGYRSGRTAHPLFGTDWEALWAQPLDQVRAQLQIDSSEIVGAGVREAA